MRCLASVGFCVDDDNHAVIVLRLWPLVTRNMGVRVSPPADGERGEAATGASGMSVVLSSISNVFSSVSNNSSTASAGGSISNNSSSSGHARPPPPQPLQQRLTGAGVPPVPLQHYWPPPQAPPPEGGSQPPLQSPVGPQLPSPQPWLLRSQGHASAPYEAVAPPSAEERGGGAALEGGLEDIEDEVWDLLSESLESP